RSYNPVTFGKLDAVTLSAYDLLRNKCAKCHNPKSTTGAKSFSNILDGEDLIKRGIVRAGDLKSKIIKRTEDGSMPDDGPELTSEEEKILKDWVSQGAKSFSG